MFENLPFRIYPISETDFLIFNLHTSEFKKHITFQKDPSFDCCLKYFDENRVFENETNVSKLAYLNRNIRASEKIGFENHIYLHYDDPDLFSSLLLTSDWSNLLAEKKFVICVGKESFLSPEDFGAHFQVSYENCTPQPPSVSEISRMIFGWKIANVSGTFFLADVLDYHPQLLTLPNCFFNDFYSYYMKYLHGKSAKNTIRYLCTLRDEAPERSLFYSLTHKVDRTLSDELVQELNRLSTDELLKKTGELLSDFKIPTAREWITAIYLAFSLCHGRTFTQRVTPAVFIYPHDDMFFLVGVERSRVDFYLDTVCSFDDYKAIAIIRDPVTQAGSVIRFMTETHPQAKNEQGERQLDPFYCMAFGSLLPKDYFFRTDHVLFDHISVVRFEDLKLNPKASIESLTDFLDLSSSDILYRTTWCGLSKSGITTDGRSFEGFDPSPIYNDHSRYLSTFDKYRIEMTLYQLMLNYGYCPMYYEGEEFSDDEKFTLLQYPFRCESIPLAISDEARKHSREGALNLIKISVIFHSSAAHPPIFVDGLPHPFAPIPWLKPKAEFLEQPLYESQIRARHNNNIKNGADEREIKALKQFLQNKYMLKPDEIGSIIRQAVTGTCTNGFNEHLTFPDVTVQQDQSPVHPAQALQLGKSKLQHIPKTYWITGLSGAGKTTIGTLLYQRIRKEKSNVVFLDGDTLRQVFGGDLGYSLQDRLKSATRNAHLCKMLTEQGLDVVCCTISMFDSVRQWNRENIPGYIEIYVKVSAETLQKRDQKNLYTHSDGSVAGVDFAIEEPKNPDIILENDGQFTIAEQVNKIIKFITE